MIFYGDFIISKTRALWIGCPPRSQLTIKTKCPFSNILVNNLYMVLKVKPLLIQYILGGYWINHYRPLSLYSKRNRQVWLTQQLSDRRWWWRRRRRRKRRIFMVPRGMACKRWASCKYISWRGGCSCLGELDVATSCMLIEINNSYILASDLSRFLRMQAIVNIKIAAIT